MCVFVCRLIESCIIDQFPLSCSYNMLPLPPYQSIHFLLLFIEIPLGLPPIYPSNNYFIHKDSMRLYFTYFLLL
jgi:hypothetical protein